MGMNPKLNDWYYIHQWSWLHRLIYDFAWPAYACQYCVGQEPQHGCYCYYHKATAPYEGPEWYHEWARKLWSVVAKRGGYYDPA